MEDLQMNIKLKNKLKKILSSVMAAGMSMSLIPSVSFAAQSNEYVDPADVSALYAICLQQIFHTAYLNIRVLVKRQ